MNKTVLAIGAHPDDIEFLFAGTLLLLKARGWQIHVCNLANGSAGSKTLTKEDIIAIYHSPPLGCVGPLGEPVMPSFFVDISTVVEEKLKTILCHESQMSWLGATQEITDLGEVVLTEAKLVGSLSGAFPLAEAWTPHH